MQPNKPVVLVVDDDPVNLDILVQTLEQDYFLIIAKNGKRAMDLAFSHHPDLILLDILMPEMDGFEVCQRLKADKETEGWPASAPTSPTSASGRSSKATTCSSGWSCTRKAASLKP